MRETLNRCLRRDSSPLCHLTASPSFHQIYLSISLSLHTNLVDQGWDRVQWALCPGGVIECKRAVDVDSVICHTLGLLFPSLSLAAQYLSLTSLSVLTHREPYRVLLDVPVALFAPSLSLSLSRSQFGRSSHGSFQQPSLTPGFIFFLSLVRLHTGCGYHCVSVRFLLTPPYILIVLWLAVTAPLLHPDSMGLFINFLSWGRRVPKNFEKTLNMAPGPRRCAAPHTNRKRAKSTQPNAGDEREKDRGRRRGKKEERKENKKEENVRMMLTHADPCLKSSSVTFFAFLFLLSL